MRSDHTAAEFVQPQAQPLLASSLDTVDDIAPQKPMRALTRVTFCFAWLFGLEAFLAGSADDAPRAGLDRRH
jgi:hypothetical protein